MKTDTSGSTGRVTLRVTGPDGELKYFKILKNLITDKGDEYHVKRIAAAVAPAAPSDVTKMTGMKLGTGTTAVAKAGAGAALVTYLSGSNVAFAASYPVTTNLGAGLGWVVTYRTIFLPGVGTHAALTELVIVNDSSTDATTTAANTLSRVVFTATPKGALDTLTVDWSHKQLGS